MGQLSLQGSISEEVLCCSYNTIKSIQECLCSFKNTVQTVWPDTLAFKYRNNGQKQMNKKNYYKIRLIFSIFVKSFLQHL